VAHIAVLGAGLIGQGFVHNFVNKGVDVVVWNRTASKATALAAALSSSSSRTAGAGRVRAVEAVVDAVADADRVHLALTDDAAVDAVLDAIAGALRPSTIVIDHTTTQPAATVARTARCAARGLPFVHAPIFMSPTNAKNGTGLMLVGGDPDRVAAVVPALHAMTGEVWNVGAGPERAAFYKLCGNAMILTMAGALADIFRMAEGIGLPREEALAVFQKFQPQGIIAFRGPKMARREFSTSFAIEVARKDVRLMQETAAPAGNAADALAVLDGLAARMDQLIAAGHGALDIGALAR
jgi:3-hydroxyisobutyrate dehydrogenase-like beta-hydroxyacid dehydrogenase